MPEAVMAPELPEDLEWVNTDNPPTLEDNLGRVVVLVFWTYSSLNCRHTMAALREFQIRFEGSIAIVGIHCPRFEREESAANVLKAINRWHVRFPVAIDNRFATWHRYGISGWPSMLVVDCEGKARKLFQGDNQARAMESLIDRLLLEAAASNQQLPGEELLCSKPEPRSVLRFPSSIVQARGMLFISDTGNNRVVEVAPDGRIKRAFGSGNAGLWDGFLDNCGFNGPTGLAYSDNYIYVADTGNHAIRRIKLMTGEVETIAGNGQAGYMAVRNNTEMRQVALSSPMGMVLRNATLYVTMSGMNQIWALDLEMGSLNWLSGSGQATVKDGAGNKAGFASPRGIALSGDKLLVVDAEGSAVREVAQKDGSVRTLFGNAGEYTYGLTDGNAKDARLQYPTAIAVTPATDRAYVADTFNGRLRTIDLRAGEVLTEEFDSLNEPQGLCLFEDTIWIADTNNHGIVKMDLRRARGGEQLVVLPANQPH